VPQKFLVTLHYRKVDVGSFDSTSEINNHTLCVSDKSMETSFSWKKLLIILKKI